MLKAGVVKRLLANVSDDARVFIRDEFNDEEELPCDTIEIQHNAGQEGDNSLEDVTFVRMNQ